MRHPRFCCITLLLLPLIFASFSFGQKRKEALEELDAFEVIASSIDVIDGFTGKEYEGNSPIVWQFVDQFRKLLTRYHRHLLSDEAEHMRFQIDTGLAMAEFLESTLHSFGVEKVHIERENWLVRESAILRRLSTEPFFKIKSIIVWDQNRLDAMAPKLPDSKFARDLRFNDLEKRWERRITTEWEVITMAKDHHMRVL